jgi:hypothetical protein
MSTRLTLAITSLVLTLLCVATSALANVPAAPSGLILKSGYHRVTLTWTASANATSYVAQRWPASGPAGWVAVASSISGTTYVDLSAENNNSYYYQVLAQNGEGLSSPSNAVLSVAYGPMHVFMTGPGLASVGKAASITVTVLDVNGETYPSYAGQVSFTSVGGAAANLPAPYMMTASDAGTHTFSYTPPAAGTFSIQADVQGATSAGLNLTVVNAIAARGDVTGDGKADIILQHSSGLVALWQMNGAAVEHGAVIAAPASTWKVRAGSGDYDNDARADVLLQNSTTGEVARWRVNNGTISGALIASPGTVWTTLGYGDFDADGKSDVIVQNGATRELAQWLMADDHVRFGTLMTMNWSGSGYEYGPQLPAQWQVVGTADLNGDGRSDVVLQHNATAEVRMLQMGNYGFAYPVTVATPATSWKVRATGDVNGDGKADIILQNTDSGDVAVWLMNGSTLTAGAAIASPSLAWQVIGANDYDGDGRADILLRNADGDVAVWLMNGFIVSHGAVVATPGAGWTPIMN